MKIQAAPKNKKTNLNSKLDLREPLSREMLETTLNSDPKCCRPRDAVNFWRQHVLALPGFNAGGESFWILALDAKRNVTRIFELATKSFGDHQRFADELFAEVFLRYAVEFILIHSRPGKPPLPAETDFDRIRQIILSGRAKKTELLDAILIGDSTGDNSSDCFFFGKIKEFSAGNPFTKPLKAPARHRAKTGIVR